MSLAKGIVLDAHILLPAVFGERVPQILSQYVDQVSFYSPDVCFADAREYIEKLSARRGLDPLEAFAVLEGIGGIVEIVDRSLYEDYEHLACERIERHNRRRQRFAHWRAYYLHPTGTVGSDSAARARARRCVADYRGHSDSESRHDWRQHRKCFAGG